MLSTRIIIWGLSLNGIFKSSQGFFCFISRGTRSQKLGLKYEMAFVPLNIDFARGLANWQLRS